MKRQGSNLGYNYFECCMECKPPKRQPGCHGTCKEYKDARAAYDRAKDINYTEERIWGYAAKSINMKRDANVKRLKSNRRYRNGRHD